jgi:biofilm PGA synthesis N-glycosyltransferase PgaC
MAWIFWAAVAVIGHTYLGYPAWLWLSCWWRPRRIASGPCFPSISIVMVVRNEEAVLQRKLKSLLQLNYPSDQIEIMVVSDGSTDGTNRMLSDFARTPRTRIIVSSNSRGKAAGLNDAMTASPRGEVVVFTDVRQTIEPDAVRLLMQNFADPRVGGASGELMLGDPDSGEVFGGMGLYWKIEKKIREMESLSGSVVGATGAFYAVRTELVAPLPAETVLDDVYIPMQVVRQGKRVVFNPRARAWDVPDQGTEREFSRKVRTLGGNYQLMRLAPWLLGSNNPVWFRFVSHKVMRLLVPFALVALLIASCSLSGAIYRAALVLQVAFYGLSVWAWLQPKRGPLAKAADAALTFVVLNTAAMVAFANFITRRRAAWSR